MCDSVQCGTAVLPCSSFLKNCTVLGYYAASSDAFLPTFRDNLSVPYSRIKHLEEGLFTEVG